MARRRTTSGGTSVGAPTRQLRPGGPVPDPAATRPDRAGVILGRRRSLPTGRALVGGFLVAAAAVVVFAAALGQSGDHGRGYVVAARPLPAGSIIGPGDTTTETAKLPAGAAAQAYTQPSAVIGRTVVVAVAPGQLVESSLLGPPGATPALRPVSVAVDPDSLMGLEDGAAVDVLALPGSGTGGTTTGSPTVVVIARSASLESVSKAGSGLLSGPTSGTVVTLGVSTLGEAEAIVAAAHSGTVALVQAEPGDGSGPGPGPSVPAPTTVPGSG